MRYLLALLMAGAAWGQMAFNYGTVSGSSGSATALLNTAGSAYSIIFTAPTATSVSGVSFYSSTRGTANVDTLRVQITEVGGGRVGHFVTYTDASDLVNLTNNPFTDGDVLRFSAITALPTGITINTDYYVCNRTSTTFQIDDSVGCGSVVTDFSGSSGSQYCVKIIATSTTFSPTPITVATWIDFSSFSGHTLVAGRKYAATLLNTEAVPGTDTLTIQYSNYEQPSFTPTNSGGFMNSAITAGGNTQNAESFMTSRPSGYIELASGVKLGSPFYAGYTSSPVRVNGTREVGAKFTTPQNVSMNVQKLGGLVISFTGSTYPTSITYKLYSVGASTDTLLESCSTSLLGTSSTTSAFWCYLSSVRTLSPATTYRLVASATSSAGDASNYLVIRAYSYRSGQTVDIPWSTVLTYCAASCTTTSNWTDSTTETAAFIIGLDDTTPFASQGSGTGGAFVVTQ